VKTLTENEKKWLEHENMLFKREPERRLTNAARQKYFRIRQKALTEIDDLTFLLNNLPEKQLKQIFNAETLRKFFESLFTVNDERARLRLLELAQLMIDIVSQKALVLSPETFMVLQNSSNQDLITRIMAIYLTRK